MTPRGRYRAVVAASVAVVALAPLVLGKFGVSLLNDIGIGALVALGLVLLTGIGGATSFGQAAFVGIAAYATRGSRPRTARRRGSACLRAALTGIAALAIGLLTLRLGGHFLPLSTIAWGLSIALLFGNVEAFGGHTGLANIPPLRVGSWSLIEPARSTT
jgi:branched-chain amino acid transport system permease protein